jgi:hypothetical protein
VAVAATWRVGRRRNCSEAAIREPSGPAPIGIGDAVRSSGSRGRNVAAKARIGLGDDAVLRPGCFVRAEVL